MSLRINAVKRRTGRAASRSLGVALALAALLPLIAASPAAAAPHGQQEQGRPGGDERMAAAPTSIIALAVRVTDLDARVTRTYKIAPPPAEQIPLEVGDRVRVELTGTAIVNGNGVAVDVPARFEIASGDWRIDMAHSGDNSVVVSVQNPNEDHRHANPDSRSSLAFTVTGNYDLKPAMRNGRITFDIAPSGVVAGGSAYPNDARWSQAEEIAQALSFIRLDQRPIERPSSSGSTTRARAASATSPRCSPTRSRAAATRSSGSATICSPACTATCWAARVTRGGSPPTIRTASATTCSCSTARVTRSWS